MSCVDWDDGFLLGEPTLDEQHRQLFGHANALADLMFGRAAADDWQRARTALLEHASRHFQHEEGLMRAAGYPGLIGHQAQHAELLEQLQRICAAADPARRGRGDEGSRALSFLRHWLLQHLTLSDRAMISWLQGPRAPRG